MVQTPWILVQVYQTTQQVRHRVIVIAPPPATTVLDKAEANAKRPRYEAQYPASIDFDPSTLALPQDISPPTPTSEDAVATKVYMQ